MSSWRVRCALGVLLAITNGVTEARALQTWCETRTPRFQLVSDLSREAQSDLIDLLVRMTPVAAPFLPGTPASASTSLKLVVFSRRGDFRSLTGKRKFAAYMQPSLQTNRLLVGPMRGSLTETTLHEYAHFLVRNRLDVSLPLWFDEGLASLLGRAEFDRSHVTLGVLPVERLRYRLQDAGGNPAPLSLLSQTLDTSSVEDWSQVRIDAFYDVSWLLAHYLYFHHLDGAPIAGTDLERFVAGRTALPEHLGQSRLELLRHLQRYLQNPPRRVQPSAPAPAEARDFHCLSPFERDHELAKAVLVQNPAAAEDLLKPYVEEHSQDVALQVTRARIALAADDAATAADLTASALAIDPRNAAALILDADLMVRDCLFDLARPCRDRWQRARSLYAQGVRQDPARFDGILGLGLALLYTGRPGEAVNYVRVAYGRAPWAALTNYYLGESYRLIGDSRARDYLQNARNWAEVSVWRLLAEASLEALDASSVPESDLE